MESSRRRGGYGASVVVKHAQRLERGDGTTRAERKKSERREGEMRKSMTKRK